MTRIIYIHTYLDNEPFTPKYSWEFKQLPDNQKPIQSTFHDKKFTIEKSILFLRRRIWYISSTWK